MREEERINTGLSFSEVLVVLTLVLVFFGSKELPGFIRKVAGFMAQFRRYSEKLKRELDDIAGVNEPYSAVTNGVNVQKDQMRTRYIEQRKKLEPSVRLEKSGLIYEYLKSTDHFRNAKAVMIYVDTGSEVETRSAIADMLQIGKRVVVPFCISGSHNLGLAEIRNPSEDLLPGEMNILEPRTELRGNFFKSDLQLIVCPGVAFDTLGGRLGRGKSYYDNFLRDLKGRIPLYGFAFDCQISRSALPFDYHDILMDQVITESGLLLEPVPQELSSVPDLNLSPAG